MSNALIWSRKRAGLVSGVSDLGIMVRLICWLLLFASLWVNGQQQEQGEQPEVDLSPLTDLGSEYENSIKLLQNRFRIDYEIDEITMVFFREYGSLPVVLVRPDGSKIFSGQADGDKVYWYDAATYDLINIKKPMPGPWQAVGQVLPESRIMVLSEVQLHAEPLPPVVFSGEILKQTAYLTNGDDPIENNQFRDVVTLLIDFVSTNNPNFDNFGAADEEIAEFTDDGLGMDETPMDGVFTGQFNLNIVPGQWIPVFRVNTPMYSREQIDDPIRLYPNPIKPGVVLDTVGDGYHTLYIDTDREHVDINSLLVDGKVRFPNGDIQTFSLTSPSDQPREHLIVNYEYGVFRINLTVYGQTHDGRNFILDVPEYSFLSEPPALQEPEPPMPEPTDGTADDITGQQSADGNTAQQPVDLADMTAGEVPSPEPAEKEDEMSTTTMVIWLVVLNGGVLLLGAMVIWMVLGKKKTAKKPKKQPSKEKSAASGGFMGIFSSWFGAKKKAAANEQEQEMSGM